MHIKPFLGTLALAVVLAGCNQPTVKAPMVQYHAPSYQTKVYRADHWRELADCMAHAISAKHPKTTYRLVDSVDTGKNQFLSAYKAFLASSLSDVGLKSAVAPTADIKITVDTYCLEYAPIGASAHDDTFWPPAVALTSLGTAIGSTRGGATPGALYGFGAATAVELWAYNTNQSTFWDAFGLRLEHIVTGQEEGAENAEIIIAVTVTSPDGTSEHMTDVVYIEPRDIGLYSQFGSPVTFTN